ncbi:leucine-rich repeat and WD repeat-containing protein 1-like [Liolophura sinensis]|uniref:leucine-rich repeat and WD repeat-containing protein 1-like n=1 Tax=Liolophura sinensis TaxID=3198878 RepID=UPI00315814DD
MSSDELTEKELLKLAGKSSLKAIQTLDLSGQDLHSIDVELFNKLTSLTELDLSNNQLTDLPRELTLPKLTSLDLAENELSSVDFVTQFPRLKSLYLKNNKQLKSADLYIAAYVCPSLVTGDLVSRSVVSLQNVVESISENLKFKVLGVWDAVFKERVIGKAFTDEEKVELLHEFRKVLLKQNFCDDNTLFKFYKFLLKSMAQEVIGKIGDANSNVQVPKRVRKRKLEAIPEDNILSVPAKVSRNKKEKDNKQKKMSTKRKDKGFTVIKPKSKPIPRDSFTLPAVPDFSPLHFVRCHSYNNNANDQETKVWQCAFEPDTKNPGKQTDTVGTCGGLIVCLLDCKTGKVMRRYKDDCDDESFYCLAWTMVTMETKDATFPTTLLAVAGEGEVIKLMHPSQLVVYAALKGHNKAIQSLLFHPEKPTHLFCGSDDNRITLWDIGVPDPVNYSTKYSQLLRLQCPGTGVLNMVYSSRLNWLVVGCEDGCYGWNLSSYKNTKREPTLQFCLPDSDNRNSQVDGLTMLPNDIIATKCVGQSVICLWRLEDYVTDKPGKSPIRAVDPLCGLRYPLTETAYINISAAQGILVAGDDHGSVYMYNLREMAKKMSFRKGVASSSRELLWPEVSTSKNCPITDLKDDVVVNMCSLRADGQFLVSGTDNNIVCIWSRD